MKRKRAKVTPESDGVVARLYEAYYKAFEERFGMKPISEGGYGAKRLKELATAWGEDAVLELIAEFFRTKDNRIDGSNYKVADLFNNAQRLRINMHKIGPREPSDRRTAENVDAATRSTGSRIGRKK